MIVVLVVAAAVVVVVINKKETACCESISQYLNPLYVVETLAPGLALDWKVMSREMVRAYRHDKIRKLSRLKWNIMRGLYWGSLNPEESTAISRGSNVPRFRERT